MKRLFYFFYSYTAVSLTLNAIIKNMNNFQYVCLIILCWCISCLTVNYYNKIKKNIERKQRKKLKEIKQKEEEIKQSENIKHILDNLLDGEIMLMKYLFYAPSSVVHLPLDNPVVLALLQKKIISFTDLYTSSIRGEYPNYAECFSFCISEKFLQYLNKNREKINRKWKDIPIADKMDTFQQNFIANING